MLRRFFRHPARGVVTLIVAFLVAAVGVTGVVLAQGSGGEELRYEGPDHPPRQIFDSVEQAQPLVPYPIRVPELDESFEIAEVAVQQVPVETRDDDLFIVFITFRNQDGEIVEMRQTNFGAIPWTDSQRDNEEVSQRSVSINNAPGIEATARDGEKVLGGYVFWEYGGVTYELAAAGWIGETLVMVAGTVK